jgi:hypothetical protein
LQDAAHICRVDVTTDGHIVFADSYGRGFDWLSLDSISFKIEGRGMLGKVSLESSNGFFCENEHRPLATTGRSPITTKFHNAHVRVLSFNSEENEKEVKSPVEFSVAGNTLARILGPDKDSSSTGTALPLQNVISIAVGLRREKVISLNHINYLTNYGLGGCPRIPFDDNSGMYKENDFVQLYGQLYPTVEFVRGEQLLLLPEGCRPKFVHDFLVVGAGTACQNDVGLAVVRVCPNGEVIFQGTTEDSPISVLLRLSLDTIYFPLRSDLAAAGFDSHENIDIGDATLPSKEGESKTLYHPLVLGQNVCDVPSPGTDPAHTIRHKPSQSNVVIHDFGMSLDYILEEAKLGGYVGCDCVQLPCSHIVEASKRSYKQTNTNNFGKACALYQTDGSCCFLSGQAFKRKRSNIKFGFGKAENSDFSMDAGFWEPGKGEVLIWNTF